MPISFRGFDVFPIRAETKQLCRFSDPFKGTIAFTEIIQISIYLLLDISRCLIYAPSTWILNTYSQNLSPLNHIPRQDWRTYLALSKITIPLDTTSPNFIRTTQTAANSTFESSQNP